MASPELEAAALLWEEKKDKKAAATYFCILQILYTTLLQCLEIAWGTLVAPGQQQQKKYMSDFRNALENVVRTGIFQGVYSSVQEPSRQQSRGVEGSAAFPVAPGRSGSGLLGRGSNSW